MKYKPISLILKIFTRIIMSNIVNLSILDSYSDPYLFDFLNNFFHIIISLSTEAITSYMKVFIYRYTNIFIFTENEKYL